MSNVDLFGRRKFAVVVREALEHLGGRTARADLVAAVRGTMTLAEYEAWAGPAFDTAVMRAAKTRGDGEDSVYAISDEIAPLRLFSIEEFRAKAFEIACLSVANEQRVHELAEICNKVHGETFDAEDVLAEARSVA